MKTKEKPTPLSRVQKRLGHWKETLRLRLEAKNQMLVGQVAVAIQGDKALEAKLAAEARAAVADWESIVRMVETHKELLAAAKLALEVRDPFYPGAIAEKKADEALSAAIAKAEGR